jgi:hypothetical protein
LLGGSERREDDLNILVRKNAWDQIGIAAKADRLNDAATLPKRFAVIARWSPELIPKDAQRLADKAKAKRPQLQKERGIARREQREHPLGELTTLDLYGSA